jgi:hypothetical protein
MKNVIAIRKGKLVNFLTMFFTLLLLCSCSDSDDGSSGSAIVRDTPYVCTSCSNTSEALVENDKNSNGIYKGVFSKGSIEINLRNGSSKAKGTLNYKNEAIDLYEAPDIILVQSKRVYVLLRGTLNDRRFDIEFSVNEDGTQPEVSDFNFPFEDSPLSCVVFKEKSNQIFEVFEGDYFLSSKIIQNDGSDELSGKVEPDSDDQNNDNLAVGNLKLVLSRSEAVWALYKVMLNSSNSAILDKGSISDGQLFSDLSGKKVAVLRGDELNNKESTVSGVVVTHAVRKR